MPYALTCNVVLYKISSHLVISECAWQCASQGDADVKREAWTLCTQLSCLDKKNGLAIYEDNSQVALIAIYNNSENVQDISTIE